MSVEKRRGWRVGHQGRDQMFYEALRDGSWERLEIDGEMLMGTAHHVIYFKTPAQWQAYPPWARTRRDEIVARITSEFRPPDYEYDGLDGASGGASGAPPPAPPSTPPRPSAPPSRAAPPAGHRTLLAVVAGLFLLAALMGWLVATGVARGETRLPLKRQSLRRPVTRAAEPATYWLSISVYAAVGTGLLWLGVLGARAARQR